MPSKLITPPADEPVTLGEAKEQLRLTGHAEDDVHVSALITTARQHIEKLCWRGFLSQTWDLTLPAFPAGDRLVLPRGEVSAVTYVKYVDTDGVLQDWDASNYDVDATTVPGYVRVGFGKSWPSTRDVWFAVQIRYLVGAATAADVPGPVKSAILLMVADMYEHRTTQIPGVHSRVDHTVRTLVEPYRLVRH